MSRATMASKVVRVASSVLFLCTGVFGCATAGGEGAESSGERASLTDASDDGDERKPPPEVTDRTVDPRPGWARSVRPRVDVRLEQGALAPEDVANYESTVQRGAVRCYQSSLRETDTKSEGSVVYEVIVTRNGYVAGADVMSTALKRRDVRRCVERVISRIRFSVPGDDRPVYRLFFRLNFFLETLVPDKPPV